MQYRLLTDHVTPEGAILAAGTVVGDDQPCTWRYTANNEPMPPTPQMEGVDDAGKKAIDELNRRLYGDEVITLAGPSEAVAAARKQEAEAQEALDKGSEPVSPQQRWERKQAEDLAKAREE